MARKPDRLSIVEAIWEMELSSPEWMTRMASAVHGAIPELGSPTAFHGVVEDMQMRILDAGVPPGGEHLRTVLESAARTPRELIARTRMQGATGLLAFRHADAPETGALEQVAPALGELGGRDILTIGARDGRGETVCLTGTMPTQRPMRRDERRSWEAVSAHLGAALRLRQRGASGEIDDADFVFDAHGSVVHRNRWSADACADEGATLAQLRDRIAAVDVGRSRRSSTWMDAIFDGEWSVVARREHGVGVQFLAIRNPVDAAPMRQLTRREVDVVRALMRDVPAKVVADELGITESALTRRSMAAFRKLGVRSRAECMLVFATLTTIGAVGPSDEDPTEGILRVAFRIQELCVARGLTPAESSIVPMLITGVSDAAIAERRGVSRRTVANQTASIFRKLRVSSRFELAHALTRALTDVPLAMRKRAPAPAGV